MSNKTKLRLAVIGVLFIVFSMLVGIERIDAGNVGIKVNMTGGNQGIAKTEYVTGWCFYWRLAQKVYEFPTFQQHKEYDPYNVPAKGGIVFTVHPTFNYNLAAGEVGSMFSRYRLGLSSLEEGFIRTSMLTAIREVTNTFSPDSILNNQAGYDAAILAKLQSELQPYFQITQFTANLVPDETLKAAIASKARAVQEAQAALAGVAVAQAQSQIDITNAKKDSAVNMINKQSEARGIEVVNEALKNSPQFVEKIKAERWDGHLPQYMFGSGTMPMIQLNNK